MHASAMEPRAPRAPAPGPAPRRPPASPELLRCSRRRRPGAGAAGAAAAGAAVAVAVAVARRNERERNRVRLVNSGFQALRQHVPPGGAGRRLSKVDTLRSAVDYIRALQRLLAEHDAAGRGSGPGSPRSAPPSPPSPDGGGDGALGPAAARELLDLSAWLGGC